MPDTVVSPHPDRHVPVMLPMTLTVNGTDHTLTLDARTTLLDALREHLHLTGSKKGCDHGQCGACTVLVNGQRVNACLALAVMHPGGLGGDHVTTIEGLLGPDGGQHPIQAAFIAHDAFQCGYCTPGQIMSVAGMLAELEAGVPSHAASDVAAAPAPTDAEIRERMSGNLCRCGAYTHIVDAVRALSGGTDAQASASAAGTATQVGRTAAAMAGAGAH